MVGLLLCFFVISLNIALELFLSYLSHFKSFFLSLSLENIAKPMLHLKCVISSGVDWCDVNSFHVTCLFLYSIKNRAFSLFAEGIERDRLHEMGKGIIFMKTMDS